MRILKFASALLLGTTMATAARADGDTENSWDHWYNASIQYAYSWDTENDFILGSGSDSGDRHQGRAEWENIWKYGENYFFVDWYHTSSNLGGERDFGFPCCGDGKNDEFYAVANSNLSLQKVMGWQRGLFDAALEGRAEYGTFFDYHALAIGASLYVNLPGFVEKPGDKIQLTWWHRWNDDSFADAACFGNPPCATGNENKYADHNLLGLTIRKDWEMFNMRWQHQTFLRVQLEQAGSNTEIQRFNRVFWESEIFAYLTKDMSVGFRSEYFWDDGGISFNGVKSDWRPMVAIKYDLGRSD